MIVVTSCSNDNDEVLNNTIQSESVSADETMLVSFTLEQPVMQTRAFSDGLTATTLTYAVYKAGDRSCLLKSEDEVTFTDRVATVDIRLEKGQNYDILFWADAPDTGYYTFDENTQTITMNYGQYWFENAQEDRDAFYAAEKNLYVDPSEATGGVINKTVILTRPFAQLNIGATDYSEELSMRSYCSYFQYLYSNLNLYTEEVSGEAKIIYAVGFTEITEPFPVTVEGADIKYLAMYYLPASTEESSVRIGFYMLNDVNDYNTPNMISFITDVPLRRNYRTNLYGPLFSNVLPGDSSGVPDAPDVTILFEPE